MVEVTTAFLTRLVQPLQQCYHPLWEFNGSNDSTQVIAMPFADQQALAAVLAGLYDEDEQAFAAMKLRDGYNTDKPIQLVRLTLLWGTISFLPEC